MPRNAPSPPPPPSSSSESKDKFAEVRTLVAKYDARQKEKAQHKAGQGDGGGVSGTQGMLHRSAGKGKGAKLMQLLSASKRPFIVPDSGSSSEDAPAPKSAKSDDYQKTSKHTSKGDALQTATSDESAQPIT